MVNTPNDDEGNCYVNNIQMLQEPTPTISTANKPIELYIFVDPLCPEAFSMQATLRKLQLEYNHYFTWRFVLSTELTSLNCLSKRVKGCISGIELDINHPVLPSIAIKANLNYRETCRCALFVETTRIRIIKSSRCKLLCNAF